MYKKIMVAIDRGDVSQKVLEVAENIAHSYNAALCIVHSVSDEENRAAGEELLNNAEASIKVLSIEKQLLQSEAEYGTHSIADVVAAAVKEWGADLVVVGTANRRGLERFVVGSVAEQLIAKIDASILLVRPQ